MNGLKLSYGFNLLLNLAINLGHRLMKANPSLFQLAFDSLDVVVHYHLPWRRPR